MEERFGKVERGMKAMLVAAVGRRWWSGVALVVAPYWWRVLNRLVRGNDEQCKSQ